MNPNKDIYISQLETIYSCEKISKTNYTLLSEKIHSNDSIILKLFETLYWSKNERSFLEKIQYVFSQEKPNFEKQKKSKLNKNRPDTVTVPFDRELTYYSTMESNSFVTLNKENTLNSINMVKKAQLSYSNIINFSLENKRKKMEDLDCSLDSIVTNEEENYKTLSKKKQLIKSINFTISNTESSEININEDITKEEDGGFLNKTCF